MAIILTIFYASSSPHAEEVKQADSDSSLFSRMHASLVLRMPVDVTAAQLSHLPIGLSSLQGVERSGSIIVCSVMHRGCMCVISERVESFK